MENKTLEDLIRGSNALTYLNALKTATAELKEELSSIEETSTYLIQAVERSRKIIRRIDNQYRAVVKCAQGPISSEVDLDDDVIDVMEGN